MFYFGNFKPGLNFAFHSSPEATWRENTGESLPTEVIEIMYISTNILVIHTENRKSDIPLSCSPKELEKPLLQMSGLE